MNGKFFRIATTIILCLFCLSGCLMSEEEKYIEAGDIAIKKGSYYEAVENYRNAGEAATDKLADAYVQGINYFIDLYEEKGEYPYDRSTRVMEWIDTLKNEKDKAVIAEVLTEVIKRMREDGESNITVKQIIAMIPEEHRSELSDLEQTIKEEDLLSAINSAKRAARQYGDYNWEKALEMCREMPEYEQAKEVLALYESLLTKPNMENAEKAGINLWNYATKEYQPETLEDSIQFHMGGELVNGNYRENNPNEKNIEEVFQNYISIFVGIDSKKNSQTLTDDMLEELKTVCGTEADNKILILHDRAIYNSDERSMDIMWSLMDELPYTYRPTDFKTVKYLIYLKSDYRKGGIFSGGTQQITETTTLSLYDTETGKELYKQAVGGKVGNVMYYTGFKPAYYSSESPDMCKAFRNVAKKITNLEK